MTGRRAAARLLGALLAAGLAFLAAFSAAISAADTPRRPGSAEMSPALQRMQEDDSQNPAQLWVQEGRALWSRAPAQGQACSGCHGGDGLRDAATRHPAIDPRTGLALTLAGRVDACRQRHQGQPAQGADGDEVLPLTAWLAHQARGQVITPPDDPRLATWQARGQALWLQRMGQLNLACTQCHDQQAGQRLGGAPIPQGHPSGYPIYRLEWQAAGSLERRLRSCLTGVRAEPFAPGADEMVALEAWLMRRAAGMRWEGAALRP